MKLLLENWQRFLNESDLRGAIDYLEGAFEDKHASGRPYSKIFDGKIDEESSNITIEIVNQITPKYLTQVLKKYKSVGFEGSIDMNEIKDPREIAIINSILLFTAGNIATVRKPHKFSDKEAEDLESPVLGSMGNLPPKYHRGPVKDNRNLNFRDTSWFTPYVIKPTKELYTIATYVMTQISNLKNPDGSTHIYRGMGLPAKVALNLKEGSEFFGGSISSWTMNKKIAEDYMYKGKKVDGPKAICMFEIESAEKGANIDFLSAFKYEREFILGGKIKIVSIKISDVSDMMGKPPGSIHYARFKCDEV